jgi:hypothetical protein
VREPGRGPFAQFSKECNQMAGQHKAWPSNKAVVICTGKDRKLNSMAVMMAHWHTTYGN